MRDARTALNVPDTGDREREPWLRFQDLGRGEQLTLWSFRAIALGHADCPTLRRALQVALGSSAEEAFAALFLAVRTLGWCARRRLRLHVPGCDRVSEDEQALLALVAAARRAFLTGDEGEVRRRLEMLVEPRLAEGLLTTLQTVTSALEVNGYPYGPEVGMGLRRLH